MELKMELCDIYPPGCKHGEQYKKEFIFYLSVQHNNGKLDRIPLTATGYKDFLVDFLDMKKSNSEHIWLESVYSVRYIISKEVLMNGIIKIEKS